MKTVTLREYIYPKPLMNDMRDIHVSLFDLAMSLSEAIDLVSPDVANHHAQVAYMAYHIGAQLDLSPEQKNDLMLAGMLHDVGALSLRERVSILQFEESERFYQHAELSYLLLRIFQPLLGAATLIRFHHLPWNNGGGSSFKGLPVPIGSHILHLADRVYPLIDKQKEILGQRRAICEKIKESSGSIFMPELVDVFCGLSAEESFWFDTVSLSLRALLANRAQSNVINLSMDKILRLANVFSKIIDFRSPFTATHSDRVAATAKALARFAGFSERECLMMEIAGYLHDLGKLSVPAEILEKPAGLAYEESNVIRKHTYHTYRIIDRIGVLGSINEWASYHHETLDGTGYPFKLKGNELSMGSRIMAVTDVFSAVTEDRPYRKGMPGDDAFNTLQLMSKNGKLDSRIISLLMQHHDEIRSLCAVSQQASKEYYEQCFPGIPAR